jgi:hypothetical protein
VTTLTQFKIKRLGLYILSPFICFLFFVSSCKKSEDAGVENSSLLVLGNQSSIELVDLTATADGGFILTGHKQVNEHVDILVQKYNHLMELEWERVVGGKSDDQLDLVLVDSDQNILIVGFSYAWEEDNLPLSRVHSWVPYGHKFDISGKTIWEKGLPGYPRKNRDQKWTSAIQNSDGDYVLIGQVSTWPKQPGGITYPASIFPLIRVMSPDGTTKSELSFVHNVRNSRIESIYEFKESYWVFGNQLDTMGQNGHLVQVNKDNLIGVNQFIPIDTFDVPLQPSPINRLVGRFNCMSSDNKLMQYSFFPNDVFRFGWDLNNISPINETLNPTISDLKWARKIDNERLLVVGQKGLIMKMDLNLNPISSIISVYPIDMACILNNGTTVAAFEESKTITLIHYNVNGEVITK